MKLRRDFRAPAGAGSSRVRSLVGRFRLVVLEDEPYRPLTVLHRSWIQPEPQRTRGQRFGNKIVWRSEQTEAVGILVYWVMGLG